MLCMADTVLLTDIIEDLETGLRARDFTIAELNEKKVTCMKHNPHATYRIDIVNASEPNSFEMYLAYELPTYVPREQASALFPRVDAFFRNYSSHGISGHGNHKETNETEEGKSRFLMGLYEVSFKPVVTEAKTVAKTIQEFAHYLTQYADVHRDMLMRTPFMERVVKK